MKIIIVGAGISGLYSAYLLLNAGFDVEIFEASSRSGGRISSLIDEQGQFVELGAEVVYAPDAPLMRFLNIMEIPMYEYRGLSHYYFKHRIISEKKIEDFPDLDVFIEKINKLEDYDGPEMSLLDYFENQKDFNVELHDLLNAFACEYGTTAEKIAIKSLADEETNWTGGDEEYYTKQPFQLISDYFHQKSEKHINFNKKIAEIIYSKEGVTIIDQENHKHNADKVLVSVNIGVLKTEGILFDPPLPAAKQHAIESIGIDKGIKIILQFTQTWWPENLMTIEGGKHCFEYLASKNYEPATLTGFIMGHKADIVSGLSKQELTDILLNDLDTMFGSTSATEYFKSSYMKNWGNDELHKGAYSFSTPNSQKMREELSEPLEGSLFFIGEACNTNGHSASVHGAMETSEIACKKIMNL